MSTLRPGWGAGIAAAALVVTASLLTFGVSPATTPSYPTARAAPAAQVATISQAPIEINASTVRVSFAASLPSVELLPRVNSSWGAVLQLDSLLEIRPNSTNPGHPTVVTAAAPEALRAFNGTIVHAGSSSYVSLAAALPVRLVGSALWNSSTPLRADGPLLANVSILQVNYTLINGTDGSEGVLLSWAVSGWPWFDPTHDDLALEYELDLVAGTNFEVCAQAPGTANPDSTSCPSRPIGENQEVWDSNFSNLKGNGPEGAVASVGWGSEALAGASAVDVTAGAYVTAPGTTRLVLAASNEGSPSFAGTTVFLLSLPAASVPLATVAADPAVYGGALAASGAIAAAGIAVYRRRNRSVLEEL